MSDPHGTRSFAHLIDQLEDGALNAELSHELARLVEDLQNHAARYGGKPQARIALSVELRLDNGVIDVTCDTSTKAPKPPARRRSVFFLDAEGGMTQRNPRQQELPLRRVDTDTDTATRTVG